MLLLISMLSAVLVVLVLLVLPICYYRRHAYRSACIHATLGDKKLALGAFSDIGGRPTNEDAHLVSAGECALAGVFDGHCGAAASSLA